MMNSKDVLERFMNGNIRFTAGVTGAGNNGDRSEKLISGQEPKMVILSCSDSRVPPEIIFDCRIGDIFVVRVAGNVASGDIMASVEYGVEHAGAAVVMVMGHSNCGAIIATATDAPVSEHIEGIKKNVMKNIEHAMCESITMDELSMVNVGAVRDEILQKCHNFKSMSENDELLVVGAYYDIETGLVKLI